MREHAGLLCLLQGFIVRIWLGDLRNGIAETIDVTVVCMVDDRDELWSKSSASAVFDIEIADDRKDHRADEVGK